MKLPEEFISNFKNLMDNSEFNLFIESLYKSPNRGLRINRLKISRNEFLEINPFDLKEIPWTKDGFYFSEDVYPGKNQYHFAGLYYVQEPSAMLPAAIIDAQEGEKVLDLCAAPGGKTIQIAADLNRKGLLVANEISGSRAKVLVKNVERYGIENIIVTNEVPKNLEKVFKSYFDKILIDAPCSGEGMFRKDKDAHKSWNKYRSVECIKIQGEILENAHEMLVPGGKIIYSTCTFNPDENERVIKQFKDKFNYKVLKINSYSYIDKGRSQWVNGDKDLENALRIWPHINDGEGHFVVALQKSDDIEVINYKYIKQLEKTSNEFKLFEKFCLENLNINIDIYLYGYFYLNGNNIYYLQERLVDLKGIRISKFGLFLGDIDKNRFTPSHSFLMTLKYNDFKNVLNFEYNSEQINRYLKGETLLIDAPKNLYAITVNKFPLGWAKVSNGILKNMYPKGWRKMN